MVMGFVIPTKGRTPVSEILLHHV